MTKIEIITTDKGKTKAVKKLRERYAMCSNSECHKVSKLELVWKTITKTKGENTTTQRHLVAVTECCKAVYSFVKQTEFLKKEIK